MTLKKNWNAIIGKSIIKGYYWSLTSTNIQMFRIMKIFSSSLKGKLKVLDAGAGSLAFKPFFKLHDYTAFDKTNTCEGLDFIADAARIPKPDAAYDLVICSAVLEHTREPLGVLKETFRVIKNGGTALVTVPHFHYIHGEPEDFFRFTSYGIEYLLKEAGFSNISVMPVGGILSFAGTLFSTVFLSTAYYAGPLFALFLFLNRVFAEFICMIDGIFDREKIFALGYIVTATKR